MSQILNPETFPFLAMVPHAFLLTALVVLLVGTTILKAFALWYAARNSQPFWFGAMLVLNTLGILELVYLLGFRKDKQVYTAPAPAVAPKAPTA